MSSTDSSGGRPPWRSRGAPHYLDGRASDFGVSPASAKVIKDNRQLHRISTVLGQLHPVYWDACKRGDERFFTSVELAQARSILSQCEVEIAKLALLGGAGLDMVSEVYAAFGLDEPGRPFRVAAAVGTSDDAGLKAEVDRLRADNAELLGQNRQLVAMIEATTAPADPPESEPKPVSSRPQNKGK